MPYLKSCLSWVLILILDVTLFCVDLLFGSHFFILQVLWFFCLAFFCCCSLFGFVFSYFFVFLSLFTKFGLFLLIFFSLSLLSVIVVHWNRISLLIITSMKSSSWKKMVGRRLRTGQSHRKRNLSEISDFSKKRGPCNKERGRQTRSKKGYKKKRVEKRERNNTISCDVM